MPHQASQITEAESIMTDEKLFAETTEVIPAAMHDQSGNVVPGRGQAMLYKPHPSGDHVGLHPTGIVTTIENRSDSPIPHPTFVELAQVDGSLTVNVPHQG